MVARRTSQAERILGRAGRGGVHGGQYCPGGGQRCIPGSGGNDGVGVKVLELARIAGRSYGSLDRLDVRLGVSQRDLGNGGWAALDVLDAPVRDGYGRIRRCE